MAAPDTDEIRSALESLDTPPVLLAAFDRSGRLPLSFRTAAQAMLDPDGPALVDEVAATPTTMTWRQLDDATNNCAKLFMANGVTAGGVVVVALPNGVAHVVASHAAWKLGATVLPVDHRLPPQALEEILHRASPQTVVGEDGPRTEIRAEQVITGPGDGSRPEFRMPERWAIQATGGTTGPPKLVALQGAVWGRFDHTPSALADGQGIRVGQVQLVALPMHHGFGFGYAHAFGLAYGHRLVLRGRFDAGQTLAAITRNAVEFCAVVPTMMARMAREPGFADCDLSTITAVLHSAGPCADEVKRAWLAKIGPTRVYEAYGATDLNLACTIRGDEWLLRPGSVGRPSLQQLRIRNPDGTQARPGEVGEIFVTSTNEHPHYVGGQSPAEPRTRSVGDLGVVDADGYLYLRGRADRVINCGGAQISPEQVETTLLDHPSVADAAVYARPDPDLGAVPWALVVVAPGPAAVSPAELQQFCSARLPRDHVPRRVDIVASIERTETGKLPHRFLPTP
jgi:bile acid-coenzyme A ligase